MDNADLAASEVAGIVNAVPPVDPKIRGDGIEFGKEAIAGAPAIAPYRTDYGVIASIEFSSSALTYFGLCTPKLRSSSIPIQLKNARAWAIG